MTDVLILPQPQPLVLPSAFGLPGTQGVAGPAGDVAKVTTMAALTAIAGPANGATRFLTAAGQQGAWVFSTANLSAFVAADLQKGLYAAPDADATGASGAWVRQFDGAVNPHWFGILAGNSGATNTTAFNRMKAALKATATLSGAYGSLRKILFPDDQIYDFAATLELDAGAVLIDSAGVATATTGAGLRFPAGVTGIRLQRYDTLGASAPSGGTGTGADQSIIQNVRILGGYAGVEAEAHGVHIRAHGVKIRDCYISGFQGNGVHVNANGPTVGGNANCFEISDNVITGCRDGIYVDGDNVNSGGGDGNDLSNNRRWGLWDSGYLGNSWGERNIAENCGRVVGTTPTMVSQGGNQYAVVAGQEAGAATNAPSGTTADNTWWYYVGPGGPDTVTANIPAWTNGITVRAGGPIRTDDNNAQHIISGFYTEPGQGPSQLVWPTLVLGARQFAGVKGVSRLRHDDSGLRVDGRLAVGPYGGNARFAWDGSGNFVVSNGGAIQLQDNPLSANWFLGNYGGIVQILDGGGTSRFQITPTGVNAPGSVTSTGGGVGYATGAGGTQAQATSKATAVTLNKLCGEITLNAASLAANTAVSFTLNNSQLAMGDRLVFNHVSGGTFGAYHVDGRVTGAGVATVVVRNLTAGALAEAIVLGFAIIKATTA